MINYLNTGSAAHFGNDNPFPGTEIGVGRQRFRDAGHRDDPDPDGRSLDLRREQRRRVRPRAQPGATRLQLVLSGYPRGARHTGGLRHSRTRLLHRSPVHFERGGGSRWSSSRRRVRTRPSPAASTWWATSPTADFGRPTSVARSGRTSGRHAGRQLFAVESGRST